MASTLSPLACFSASAASSRSAMPPSVITRSTAVHLLFDLCDAQFGNGLLAPASVFLQGVGVGYRLFAPLRRRTSAHLHMSRSRNSQQAFAAGEDQIDPQRERMRAFGEFVNQAFRQLGRDHAFLGDTGAGQTQHASAA